MRPVGVLGQNALRIGSIRRHNSSGISQIVPKGWDRDFRRAMTTAPGALSMVRCLAITSFKQRAFRRFSDSFLVPIPFNGA
jgi:hypothetical protein